MRLFSFVSAVNNASGEAIYGEIYCIYVYMYVSGDLLNPSNSAPCAPLTIILPPFRLTQQ